jgi:hypothetical protein
MKFKWIRVRLLAVCLVLGLAPEALVVWKTLDAARRMRALGQEAGMERAADSMASQMLMNAFSFPMVGVLLLGTAEITVFLYLVAVGLLYFWSRLKGPDAPDNSAA